MRVGCRCQLPCETFPAFTSTAEIKIITNVTKRKDDTTVLRWGRRLNRLRPSVNARSPGSTDTKIHGCAYPHRPETFIPPARRGQTDSESVKCEGNKEGLLLPLAIHPELSKSGVKQQVQQDRLKCHRTWNPGRSPNPGPRGHGHSESGSIDSE